MCVQVQEASCNWKGFYLADLATLSQTRYTVETVLAADLTAVFFVVFTQFIDSKLDKLTDQPFTLFGEPQQAWTPHRQPHWDVLSVLQFTVTAAAASAASSLQQGDFAAKQPAGESCASADISVNLTYLLAYTNLDLLTPTSAFSKPVQPLEERQTLM